MFARDADGEARFHEAALLQSEHWHELQHVVQRRVLRYFDRHGLLDEADAQGMLSWRGSGGFSIDPSVCIEGEARAGVERLLRYCARPPFALERLYAPGGIVSLTPPESRLGPQSDLESHDRTSAKQCWIARCGWVPRRVPRGYALRALPEFIQKMAPWTIAANNRTTPPITKEPSDKEPSDAELSPI